MTWCSAALSLLSWLLNMSRRYQFWHIWPLMPLMPRYTDQLITAILMMRPFTILVSLCANLVNLFKIITFFKLLIWPFLIRLNTISYRPLLLPISPLHIFTDKMVWLIPGTIRPSSWKNHIYKTVMLSATNTMKMVSRKSLFWFMLMWERITW